MCFILFKLIFINKFISQLRFAYVIFFSVWSAAVDALIAFIRCFVFQDAVNRGILLQPVLLYLSRYD